MGNKFIEHDSAASPLYISSCQKSVRVKDGMSLRNGVRNGIIMQNTIYAGNKLTEDAHPVFAPIL